MGLADKYSSGSKYLKKDEFLPNQGVNLTVKGWGQQTWDNGETDLVLFWTSDKYAPMVCNKTNVKLLEMLTGANDEDDLVGKTIHVWHDPTVHYAGKICGGLRVAEAKKRPAKQKQEEPPVEVREAINQNREDDDIPF